MTTADPRLRGGLLLGAAVLVSSAIALILPPLLAHLPAMETPGAVALIAVLATVAIYGLLGLAGWIGLRSAADTVRLRGDDAIRWVGFGAAIGVGGLLLATLEAALAGTLRSGTAPPVAGPSLWLVGSAAILFQSAAEELFFRGWLQRGLRRLWGVGPALAASAVTFGFLHILGGARAPLSVLNTTLAGLLFGLLAERTGGLAAPIAAHAGWNWAEQMLLGLDPNPGLGPFGAMIDRDLVGGAQWGGSAEGLNGSLGTTFVLVALILPFVVALPAFRRSRAPG